MDKLEDPLGQLASTHPVANRERWVIGIVASVIFAAIAWMIIDMATQPGYLDQPGKRSGSGFGILVILATGCVVVAFVTLFKAGRAGRRERIEVYERGLSHVAHGKRRSWTWQEVTLAYVRSEPEDNEDAFLGGRNFRCTVTFTDGDQLKFNGLTRDWEILLKALAPSFRLPRNGYVGYVHLRDSN